MSIPAAHHADARALLFTDWATTVTLRRITAAYDPAAARLEEAWVDSPLSAVPGPLTSADTPHTAGAHSTGQRAFLVRSADLPEPLTPAATRILHDGREYALASIDASSLSDVVVLHARTLP